VRYVRSANNYDSLTARTGTSIFTESRTPACAVVSIEGGSDISRGESRKRGRASRKRDLISRRRAMSNVDREVEHAEMIFA